MGKSWRGGKGDESRVASHNSYRDNYDKINFKNKVEHRPQISTRVMKPQVNYNKYLFLDDVRIPTDAYLWDDNQKLKDASGIGCNQWDIVRSYEEFTAWIDENGIPDVVSFDNDLFDVMDESVSDDDLNRQFQMDNWQEFEIKTGAHCAQYLVAACKAHGKSVPKYYVHSANNAARPIIREILDNGI